jgi:C4-dicarboxylate-binding protein DctP
VSHPRVGPHRSAILGFLTLSLVVPACAAQSPATSVSDGAPTASAEATTAAETPAAEVLVLRLSHDQPIEHPNTANIELFAKEVEERSNGSLQIEIFPAAQLFDEETVLPAIQRGDVDMGLVSAWESLEPATLIVDLPFLFTSWDEFHAAIDGEVGELMIGAYEDHGFKTLYFQDNTAIDLVGTRNKLIKVPDDVRGLRLRSFSEALSYAMTLWGASPTQIPGSETYTAVERGTVDGLLSGVSFYERKWYEVVPYISQIPLQFSANPLQMNMDKWNELTPEQQNALTEAAQVALADNREVTPEANAEAYSEMENGLAEEWYVATDDELQQWRDASQGVEEWYLDQAGDLGEQMLEAAKGN